MQCVDATQTSSPAPARPGQTHSFAAGWMQKLAVTDAAWRARGAPSRSVFVSDVFFQQSFCVNSGPPAEARRH
eukprot:2265500-Rhodomonas_salina.1